MTKEQLKAFREFKAKFGKNFVFKSNKKKLDYTLYFMLYKEPIKYKVRVRVAFEKENGKIVAITLISNEKKFEGKPQPYTLALEEKKNDKHYASDSLLHGQNIKH